MDSYIPDLIWFNGSLVPWEDAKVHVWSELAISGASVFEGIRAFWNPEEQRYYVLDLESHIRRLNESARLLKFPITTNFQITLQAISSLLTTLDLREHAYIRPTLYIDHGRYGSRPEETLSGMHIAAFPSPHSDALYRGIRCAVSSWRRSSELNLSPRIKAGGSYMAFRLPFIEARERGFDDVILLNNRDTVSESSGAAVFVVKGSVVATPPLCAGILESITRRRIISLLRDEFFMEVQEREIVRTELYTADEVFLCGTLCEVQPVVGIDGYLPGDGMPGPLTTRCRDYYIEICESGASAPSGWLTPIEKTGVRQ
jgi:branched-chain amino acid aminotransferase